MLYHKIGSLTVTSDCDKLLQEAGLHEEVLRALCRSLLMLAQAFTLIIQSKHWDGAAGDDSNNAEDEQMNNLMFRGVYVE